ncbi:hypothetical protein ACPOL_2792 [Acidisarcina polymorpha]|uniref:Uncharacterized protein n=1 Tax=Acidisarcina polymorpha TaxID=2211140 RepID=A0A2Z5FZE2_9BACT|nr:hypothetical protein ACPOL_2792 [Acidisarcina polymorpha]
MINIYQIRESDIERRKITKDDGTYFAMVKGFDMVASLSLEDDFDLCSIRSVPGRTSQRRTGY